jgi:adiponectin receptor
LKKVRKRKFFKISIFLLLFSDNLEKIVNYHDAPEFLRDNEYILRGYRLNFNSAKKIMKSLFMIHNESVNVWTHLIGSIFIIVLFLYTALFIKTRYFDVENMQDKFGFIKSEINNLKTPLLDTIHYFDNITEKSSHIINEYFETISNKTVDYFHHFDEKLGEYKDYISKKVNCLECLKEIYSNLTNFTDHYITTHLGKVKEMLVNETTVVISSINISSVQYYINKTNMQLIEFRDTIIDNLESKEMEWVDVYTSSKDKKNTNIKKWPLFVFLFGAVSCLSMSSLFHLYFVHSKDTSEFLARLDYAGISLLIAGSCFPIYYYSYFCFNCKKYFNPSVKILLPSTD